MHIPRSFRPMTFAQHPATHQQRLQAQPRPQPPPSAWHNSFTKTVLTGAAAGVIDLVLWRHDRFGVAAAEIALFLGFPIWLPLAIYTDIRDRLKQRTHKQCEEPPIGAK